MPSSSTALRDQIAKARAAKKQDVEETPAEAAPKPASSSNALREQIAKARAAAKQQKTEPTRNNTPPTDMIIPDPAEIATFDFGLDDDPFNQRSKGGKSVLRRRIDSARSDGRLNIAAMGLKEIPDNVLSMYIYDPNDTKVAWGEVVDLSTILAADNELEILPDSMFPDVSVEDMIDSDEAGPQFGGVQSIDFHGNMLRELPVGLRRLTQLSKLNLVSFNMEKNYNRSALTLIVTKQATYGNVGRYRSNPDFAGTEAGGERSQRRTLLSAM
jgi:hypothetical protein